MKYIEYECTDQKSGQCAKGTAAALSELVGVRTYEISRFARENHVYQGRYSFRKLQKEGTRKGTKKRTKWECLWQQWDTMHQIYLELKVGKRCIQKAADGRRYAVKVKT